MGTRAEGGQRNDDRRWDQTRREQESSTQTMEQRGPDRGAQLMECGLQVLKTQTIVTHGPTNTTHPRQTDAGRGKQKMLASR